MAFVQAFANWR